MLVYALLPLGDLRRRPFSSSGLNYSDFGSALEACDVLASVGLIQALPLCEELEYIYTKPELKKLLRSMGLPLSGTKANMAKRLSLAGFKIDRRKHRQKLFFLTPSGSRLMKECRLDERIAIRQAISALCTLDYSGAVSAYRDFDDDWGFSHPSGKNHTIFANYDIPPSRFRFIEHYPMREVLNSSGFKSTLRACLLAGLMRGCQEKWELSSDFVDVCGEMIICPDLLRYYENGDFDGGVDDLALSAMRENISKGNLSALAYYIARVLYLSRE